jgi:hypothetical protein
MPYSMKFIFILMLLIGSIDSNAGKPVSLTAALGQSTWSTQIDRPFALQVMNIESLMIQHLEISLLAASHGSSGHYRLESSKTK